MKKRIALLLATVITLLAIAPVGSAVAPDRRQTRAIAGGTIQVGTASGSAGGTVDVPVTVAQNPGFAGFTLEVSNPTELQLTKVSKGSLLQESDGGALTVNTSKGLINWNDTLNLSGDGQLLILSFAISENAANGDYAVSIALKEGKPSNMVNQDGTPITFTYAPGKVTVVEAAHEHNYAYSVVVTPPTCTAQGYTTHTCVCGDSYVDTYVDSLGHDWGDWVLTTIPTETTPGEETRTCARCGATETREPGTTSGSVQVGIATGKPGDPVTVSVDITDNPGFAGFTLEAVFPTELQLKKVTKGDLLKESEGGALTSNVAKGLINWNDTGNLSDDGQILVLTFEIASNAADGDYAVSLMIKEGKPSNFVNENGKPISVTFLPGKVTVQSHTHEYVDVVTAPTCTEQGYTTHTCSCGDSFVDTYVDALGHDWDTPSYVWADDCSTVTASRTCKRVASHIETETANTTSVVSSAATCAAQGKTTYTAVFLNAAFSEQTKTVANIPALGHNYELTGWDWTGYTAATATFTCKNDANHVQTVNATITNVRTEPTCTALGKIEYTAKVSFEGKEYTDTKTQTLVETGHSYELTGWNWTGYAAATATFTCKNDATHVETADAVITNVRTEPTCEADGKIVYTAIVVFNGKTYTDTKTQTLAATGHDYELTGWSWTDYTAATATFTCKNDSSHVQTVNAKITAVRTEPTCESAGQVVYTATITFEGKTFTDKKTETLAALGHDWNEPTYTWADDCSTATAARTCKRDASHTETETVTTSAKVTKPATCVEKGETTFTATFKNPAFVAQSKTVENIAALGHTPGEPVKEKETEPTCTELGGYDMVTYCAVCGTELNREHTAIEAIGHAYELTGWNWTGYTAAEAVFTCKNDADHVETVGAAITSVRTEPTTEKDGSVVYTATAVFEDKTYTDTKTEILPALGKEYELTGWTWDGYTAATAIFTEKTDGSTVTVEATITVMRTEPTCTEDGTAIYTASVTFDEKDYTDTKTETLPALGHTPGEAVKENETAPTCTEQGGYDMVTYCAVCGAELLREHTEIAAFGHDWNEPTYTWADDCSTVTATRTCKNDSGHIETEKVNTTSKVTKEATYEQEGEITYTASFMNTAFTTQTKAVATPKLTKPDDGLPCDGGNNCPGKVFTDMPPKSNWAHDAIDWAIVNEITAGTSPTTFSPSAGCTRAQVVTFLWRAAGEPQPTTASNPFRDVKSDAYYYNAVLWAVGEGITTGTSATTFSPDATCTRGQIVAFLWRYHGSPEPASASNPFMDVKTADYYYNAVLWASVYGVTAGTSATTFSPNNTCTRDQVVTFLYRSNSYAGEMGAFMESRYEIVVDTCTWEEAQAAAAAKGGKLVTFENQYEYQYVLNLIAKKGDKNAYYHIGGRREDNSTTYYWVDKDNKPVGSALNGTTAWWNGIWETGDPNFAWEGEPETVMILYYSKTEARWCWYDGWAAALTAGRQYAYIIEYD